MTSSQTHEYPDERLCALVPVKSLARSKQRLKDCLGEDRGNLTIAMLLDVLAALNSSLHVAQVVVVTADPRVAGIAADLGAVVLDEVGHGVELCAAEGRADRTAIPMPRITNFRIMFMDYSAKLR